MWRMNGGVEMTWNCLLVAVVLAGSLIGGLGTAASAQEADGKQWVYIGTYTRGDSRGIYRGEFDGVTGALTNIELAAEADNPSFLAVHPNGKYLYAVSEIDRGRDGKVLAYEIDGESGGLRFLNEQTSRGSGPCDLEVDPSGRFVVAANYGGGSVVSIAINEDGSLGEVAGFVQHEGSSVNDSRQEGPHAHAVEFDKRSDRLFVADLGLDKVMVYRLGEAGELVANDPPFGETEGGAGPRHVAMQPGERVLYSINELDSTVTVFTYNGEDGSLVRLQRVSTLPDGYTGGNSTAEIQAHPDGHLVYASNRGHDSIAIYGTDSITGILRPMGHESTRGQTPRYFGIDPSGRFLLAGNQRSNDIAVFSIDRATGGLSAAGDLVAVPSPVCMVFVGR